MRQLLETFDFIIIGAGIAGAGMAAHLPADKSVLLLEREAQAGYHSTGRSAALFIQSYGNATIRELNRRSLPLFQQPERYGIERPLLAQRGLLSLCAAGQEDAFADLLADNPQLEAISPEQAQSYVSILRTDTFVSAAYEPLAYDIDVDLLHQGWLKQAKQRGHQLITEAEVQALQHTADAGWQISSNAGEFRGKVLVNAAGAWADEIAQLAGLTPLGLTPKRRSMAVIPLAHADAPDWQHWPMFGDMGETWYAKPEAGRLLVSPADEDPVPPCDAYVDDGVLAEGIARFEEAVTYEVQRLERSWAGLRTFAPDKTPIAGFDPRQADFFWLAGQGGYGIQTAPALSALAAELALQSVDTQDALIALLSPTRFF